MKCHILFSEKNKKNISKCRLLKILPRVLSVNYCYKITNIFVPFKIEIMRVDFMYKGPAKSFFTGFGLLQCHILSNIFLIQTFKVFPLY